MRKRFAIIVTATVLALSMTVPTFSAAPGRGRNADNYRNADSYRNVDGYGICIGLCGNRDYCLLRDESGAFVDRDTFETNLDKAIDDGLVKEEDREYYLEMYNYCIENGNSAGGLGKGRRNGGGRGMNFYTP